MRVLHISNYFHPATNWGGPVFAMHALCNNLARDGRVEQSVLTTDSMGPNTRERMPRPTHPVRFEAGYDVYYSRITRPRYFSFELLRRAPGLVRQADIIHVTGGYTLNVLWGLCMAARYGKPVVWSARGAVLALHEFPDASKPRAKRIFIAMVRRLLSPTRAALHCTSEAEVEVMQTVFPGLRTRNIPNGVDQAPTRDTPDADTQDGAPLRLLFLSRLDPKKGIETLIEAMGRIEGQAQGQIHLDVYGEGPADYEAALTRMVADQGLTGKVTFHGHVDGDAREDAFAKADIFVLPSYSENFGNVIAEALIRGVPVITTTNTPWQGLETHGCGRWIERDPEGLAQTIQEMQNQDLPAMGARGRQWMLDEFSWGKRAEALQALYTDLVAEQT